MSLGQSLQQRQLQRLSPQQIQLMKLLQVPSAQIEQRIKEELELNPALEEDDSLSDSEELENEYDEVDNSDSKRERPAELAGKMERAEKKRQQRDVIHQNAKKRGEIFLTAAGGRGIQDLTELNGYQPTHDKSRASYESLLVCINSAQKSCLHSMVRSSQSLINEMFVHVQ